jgi:excisionase family DNA binding protein
MSDDHRSPYRVTDTARRLGISDQQTLKAIKRGELDAFRVGRLWLVHPESVDRLMLFHTQALWNSLSRVMLGR